MTRSINCVLHRDLDPSVERRCWRGELARGVRELGNFFCFQLGRDADHLPQLCSMCMCVQEDDIVEAGVWEHVVMRRHKGVGGSTASTQWHAAAGGTERGCGRILTLLQHLHHHTSSVLRK